MITPSRKTTLIGLGFVVFVLLCLFYGYYVEPRRLVIHPYEMAVAGWDPAFDGFRVALISDLHGGSNYVTPDRLREIVRLTNEQNVDAVFLLGDHVAELRDGARGGVRRVLMEPREIADNIAGLRAKNGVFVILGNHDQWYDPAAVRSEFTRIGYTVLDGKLAEIHLNNGKKLRILGLKDHTTIDIWKNYSQDAKNMLAASEGTGDVIVLQHTPDVLPVITGELSISADLKVMFAGHTHGGQVWLPIIGSPIVPSLFGQKFAAGHVRDAGVDVFTTTGIGTSILPFRFFVPPEIAVVTIRRR